MKKSILFIFLQCICAISYGQFEVKLEYLKCNDQYSLGGFLSEDKVWIDVDGKDYGGQKLMNTGSSRDLTGMPPIPITCDSYDNNFVIYLSEGTVFPASLGQITIDCSTAPHYSREIYFNTNSSEYVLTYSLTPLPNKFPSNGQTAYICISKPLSSYYEQVKVHIISAGSYESKVEFTSSGYLNGDYYYSGYTKYISNQSLARYDCNR